MMSVKPDKVFCPYLGKEIPSDDASVEHVIPRSLGGNNKFAILVDRVANSELGSSVDGAVANDPFMGMKRVRSVTDYGEKSFIWKKATTGMGTPVQFVFDRSTLRFFDPVNRKMSNEPPDGDVKLKATLKTDPFVRLPFSAKVALGAGHFLFGELFRKHVAHQELRTSLTSIHTADAETVRRSKVRYFDQIVDPSNDRMRQSQKVRETVLDFFGGSSVLVQIEAACMIFSIGLFGEWFSTISAPIKKDRFPNSGDHDLGHLLVLRGHDLLRMSYRKAIYRMAVEKLEMKLPSFDEVLTTAMPESPFVLLCGSCGHRETLDGKHLRALLDQRVTVQEAVKSLPCPKCGLVESKDQL